MRQADQIKHLSSQLKAAKRDLATAQESISRSEGQIKDSRDRLKTSQKALAAVQALNFSPVQDPALLAVASKALKAAAALQA